MILQFWHWWSLALVLAIAEMLAPGFAMLWLGAAAALVGLALFLVPALPVAAQFIAFAVLAVIAVILTRRLARPAADEAAESSGLNRRGEQYVGRILVLESAITQGRGRALVGDGIWSVAGPDLPAGARVRVIATDGPVLQVVPVDEVSS